MENKRRLEVLLPEDHPVWALPARVRAKVVRAVLDAAFRRAPWPDGALEERLAAIEAKLEALEAKLGGAPVSDRQEEVPFDPAAFGRALLDAFG